MEIRNNDARNIRHFFYLPETPALRGRTTGFRGPFENSIGCVYQEKHIPILRSIYLIGAGENMFLKSCTGLYVPGITLLYDVLRSIYCSSEASF